MAARIPSLRRHKPSQQGVVTLNGKDVYLGHWPNEKRKPPASVQSAYDAILAEWLVSGRVVIPGQETEAPAVTVSQVIAAFWKHAEVHYRDQDGKVTHEAYEMKLSLRPVHHLYAALPASQFSPLKLKAVRRLMIDGYEHPKYGPQAALSRGVVNHRVRRIVRAFKWAVSEELVPPDVLHGLRSITGLEAGRTEARETEPVAPVALAHVEATIPFLNRQLAAMVRMQLLTGARPGEVCIMRACDIDMSGKVWLYRPYRHKTQHRGKARVVAIGPRAQEYLRPFLTLSLEAYLFVPAQAEAERRAALTTARKTPLSCGNSRGTNRKRKPRKKPGERYTSSSYQKAIAAAIIKADAAARAAAVEQAAEAGQEPPKEDAIFVPHWHAHQIRHTHATDVRKKYGLEAAQCALGHSEANVTELYAERDLALAVRVASEIG